MALSLLLFALVLGTIVWVLVLHWSNQYQSRRRDRLYNRWRPQILAYTAGEPLEPGLKRAAQRSTGLFMALITHQATLLSGQARERLELLVEETGLVDAIRRTLRSRSEWRAAQAARAAALFRDEKSRDGLLHLLRSRSPAVVFTAAHALARIGRQEDFPEVLKNLEEFSATNQDLVTLVLLAYGQEHPDQFLSYLQKHRIDDDDLHVIAMEVCGTLKLLGAADLLRRELENPRSEESLLKATRALGEMRALESREQVLPLARHENWAMRAIAAWTLGNFRNRDDISALRGLLEDESWAVRLNAANALAEMEAPGIQALESAAQESEDRFAIDMASRTLELHRLAIPTK